MLENKILRLHFDGCCAAAERFPSRPAKAFPTAAAQQRRKASFARVSALGGMAGSVPSSALALSEESRSEESSS